MPSQHAMTRQLGMVNPSRSSQSGVAVLAVTVVLLLVLSVMGLYANRAIWQEQKTASNQYRAKQAMEAAEAGLEYMLAVMQVKTSGTAGVAELTDYLTRDSAGRYSISNAGPVVGSPGTGQVFSVTISLIPGDTGTQRRFVLTSTGGSDCSSTTDLSTCQSRARASVKLRFTNLVANPPDSSLSARLGIRLQGSVSVTNNTGVGKAIGSGVEVTLIGGNAQGVVMGSSSALGCGSNPTTSCNDTSLQAISGDAFFRRVFGSDKATIKAAADQVLPANSTPLANAKNQLIWIDGSTAWSGGTYGTASEPVIIIVNGDLQIRGATIINGLLYVVGGVCNDSNPPGSAPPVCSTAVGSTDTHWDNQGGGNTTINGIAISEGGLTANGNPTVNKDAAILAALNANFYSVSKLMGSWKDW